MQRGRQDEERAGDHHEERDDGADREQAPVLEERPRTALAILEVLPGERVRAVSRQVVDDDLAREVDAPAGLVDPLVQLGVLVRDRAGVVSPDRLEHAAPERAVEHGLHPALVLRVPVLRAPDAERARERGAERPLERLRRACARRAADVVRAGPVQDVDRLPHVVERVLRVDVHPHDHLAAGALHDLVHPRGLEAARVVDEHDARVLRRDPPDDLPRRVARAAVRHQHLEAIRGVVLAERGPEARLDVALLVEARHGDGDERARLDHGREG